MTESRKAAGLTQVQLAKRIRVDQTTISRIEVGRTGTPDLDLIDRYAAAVGADPHWIVAPYFRRSIQPEQVAS